MYIVIQMNFIQSSTDDATCIINLKTQITVATQLRSFIMN